MIHVDEWKLGLLLWGAGMMGVVAMSGLVLPELLDTIPEMLGERRSRSRFQTLAHALTQVVSYLVWR